jgi:hypothetical protein
MNTLSRKRLADKLVEAYVDWRETCARVDDAYRSWASEAGLWGRAAQRAPHSDRPVSQADLRPASWRVCL